MVDLDKKYDGDEVIHLLVSYRQYIMECIYNKTIPMGSEEWFNNHIKNEN